MFWFTPYIDMIFHYRFWHLFCLILFLYSILIFFTESRVDSLHLTFIIFLSFNEDLIVFTSSVLVLYLINEWFI